MQHYVLYSLVIWLLFQDDHSGETAHSTRLSGAQADLFREVSDALICQCGCNLVVSQCGHVNCPSAVPIREKIESMIVEGRTKDQMLSYFMNEYSFRGNPPRGKAILSEPDTKGFDLLAWIAPFGALAVFAGVAFWVVKRRSRKTIPKTSPAPVDAKLSSMIEKELRDGEL